MGGGPESQINTWNLVRKISHFFKKTKCSKQPKKQNKPNFYFSLSGVANVRGGCGWVGSDVWDKVPKKTFFLTPSLTYPVFSLKKPTFLYQKVTFYVLSENKTLFYSFLQRLLLSLLYVFRAQFQLKALCFYDELIWPRKGDR